MFRIFLALFLVSCLSTSCKLNKLYNQTVIENEVFSTTFNFKKLPSGHIVIPVLIKGTEYSFLLDTGTPNIISRELAEALKLEHVYHKKYLDSQDNSLELSLTIIDKLSIGGINFLNNATTIHNFDKSPPTIRCLNISGVIGANLMKKAVWEFDFEKNEITITGNKNYTVRGNDARIDFTTGYSGTPKVPISINGIRDGRSYVDFGAKGFYKSSKKTYNKLCRRANKHKCQTTSGYGSIASGAFGYEQPDSSYVALVHSFAIGKTQPAVLNDQLITLSNHSDKLLGLDFFENYHTIINWPDREIILRKRKNTEKIEAYHSFGFRVIYRDNKLYVGFLYNNSPAALAGLKLDDQILRINEFDFDHSNVDKFCTFLNSNTLKNSSQLNLTLLRNGAQEEIVLYKKDLFVGKE
ncbi:MAG: aspartyl protease family protein [Cyclobacteriaceae bacterium]